MASNTGAADASTVVVKGIASSTSKKQIEDFFSFCGSISTLSLQQDGQHQTATVEFTKPSAANTAIMLHGSSLDGANLDVKMLNPSVDSASSSSEIHDYEKPVGQEEKPKTAIIAEYLAHGYLVSDDVVKRAIELDNKHGLSTKFRSYLTHLDRSFGEKLDKATSSKLTTSSSESDADAAAAPQTTASDASAAGIEASKPEPSLSRHVQQRANAVFQKPEVKSKTDFAWTKFNEYYNTIANHPTIHAFYTKTSKTVTDVHEEAKRIAEKKKEAAAAAKAQTEPSISAPLKQMSTSWVLLAVLLFSSLSLNGVNAHGHGGDDSGEIAEVAGYQQNKDSESYIQRHMRNEHHVSAFNMGGFFGLHDLDRNGVWDRSEIEAIYGVHHSESKKHSANAEIHDEKANKIVAQVLRSLDDNGDGLITKQEFVKAGPSGLPSFEEFGKNALGHHYDEESEFFVHHEEIYHNTPESQVDESYTHPEDLEHFAKHEKIEEEEERRERKAEGMPSIEEDQKKRKEAQAKGEKYESPYDKQLSKEEQAKAQVAHEEAERGFAIHEAETEQHVFKTPSGIHRVVEQPIVWQEPELTDSGKAAHPSDNEEPLPQGVADHIPGETEEGRRQRLLAAKAAAAARPSYGKGYKGFAYPKDDADRLRKGTPYKYRVKKQSFFGEF